MANDRPKLSLPAVPYAFPHDLSLSSETTALVIVDMQVDFCVEGGYITAQGYSVAPARAVIPPIKRLLHVFRAARYPIYFTREGHRSDLSTLSSREHYRSRLNPSGTGIGDPAPNPILGRQLIRGYPGHEIISELAPHIVDDRSNLEFVIDKPGRSAFAHTELELMLRNRGIKNLVICGVTTDVCVHSTMREANDRGFDCLLVEDATAAGTEELKAGAVESIKGEGGIFGTVGQCEDVVSAVGKQARPKPTNEEALVQEGNFKGTDNDWDTGIGKGYGLHNFKHR